MHHGQGRGGSHKTPKERKYGDFINFGEIWEGICNLHHWVRGDGCPYEM